MNEELSGRLRRQEFQRMLAKKLGYGKNSIDPQKDQAMDPKIRNDKNDLNSNPSKESKK